MKLRLSYSLLDLWSKGQTDKAIAMYLHLPQPSSPALDDGKKYHQDWEKQIKETNTLEVGKTKLSFNAPKSEHIVVVSYNDRWDVKAIFDCLDQEILYEFKTGVTDISTYARSMQLPLYFLVAELANIKIDHARLIKYNQHTNETDFRIIWNYPEMVEKARNYIDTLAPEIEQHFALHNISFDKPLDNA